MDRFTTLYIDMNSFFASVEQQLNPRLRGRPVAITAIESNSGACVAASYEAKAFGVKTGTRVRDAKRLCPGIVFLPSRHRMYVRYNLQIAAVLDRMAELDRIRSVDEFQLCLSGPAQTLSGAANLVRRMKQAVAAEVGPCLRFSAGIGPNQLLAKIAGKLEKPDGFQWLSPSNMPGAIAHLAIDDLPGISRAMKLKLFRAGVYDTTALYALDPRHARMIWHSVEGERFVRALQALDVPVLPTERSGYGNSKVLSPEFRAPTAAYYVGRWLTEKACRRLRRDNRVAGVFSLSMSCFPDGRWSRKVKTAPSQDTANFLRIHRQLWREAWGYARPRKILSLSVNLSSVSYLNDRTGDLLLPLAPGVKTRGERVAAVVDMLNARFGAETVRYGINKPHPGFFERG